MFLQGVLGTVGRPVQEILDRNPPFFGCRLSE